MSRGNIVFIAVIGAVSLNLLTGVAGQVSLGSAAFLAVGAFTAASTQHAWGLNMWEALPIAFAGAGLLGLLVGLPSLRFRGFYLALTTLAMHFIVLFVLLKYQVAAGGLEGFSLPVQAIGPLVLSDDRSWYYLLGMFAAAAVLVSTNLIRTKVGRAWTAIRDRDIAAAVIGVDVTYYRLLAFTVSSAIFGVAGCLQAYYLGNVSVDGYGLDLAIQYVAMIIVGGLGSTAGAVLGALVVTQLTFVIRTAIESLQQIDPVFNQLSLGIFSLQAAAFGVVIMLVLLFEPKGLIELVRRLERYALERVQLSRPPVIPN